MKQAELVRAGHLGQQILAQQAELEARVRELSEVEARSSRMETTTEDGQSEGDQLGEETRMKLMALGEAVSGWEKENEVIWEGVRSANKVCSHSCFVFFLLEQRLTNSLNTLIAFS